MDIRKTSSTGILAQLVLLFCVLQSCGGTNVVSYHISGEIGQALICRPVGKGPFPAVVYNHGRVVDKEGYAGATVRGYDLSGTCRALAADGFMAIVPIRNSGSRNISGHKKEVSRAVDYVKALPNVDPSRVALMGFSRGGLLTLMVGVERKDLKALLILAPAPGRGHFAKIVQEVSSLNSSVLLLVESEDSPKILANFEMLKLALQEHDKLSRVIRYNRGGGHRLFWGVNYYWKDVSSFLRENLAGIHSH